MRPRARTELASLLVAVLVFIVPAGQTTAATWGPRVRVASGAVWISGLATLGDGTALAAYEKCLGGSYCSNAVYIKRSTDGGVTWGPQLIVARGNADMAAIHGRGTTADLVWRSGGGGLVYASSTDSGQSFGPPRVLSEEASTQEPNVARGPGGLVAVAWGEWPRLTDQISVRVSSDGGATFGRKASWATSEVDLNSVAVGRGVVYTAYLNRNHVPMLRHSLDSGATWSEPFRLTEAPSRYVPTVAAAGSKAYVVYSNIDENEHQSIQYRATGNKGATWSPPMVLSPDSLSAYDPAISLQGGVVQALFTTDDGLFFTDSPNGVDWSSPERVLRGGRAYLGFAGRPIVLYLGGVYGSDVYSRARMP